MFPLKSAALALFLSVAITLPALAQYTGPAAGQKLAFLGDSITQFGFQNPAGYVNLVALALKNSGHEVVVVPAGISGNTSKDMLARLQRDVLAKKPDWMTLSCGVNDVWHGLNGVDLESYKTNITSIVDQCTKAGIKVVILTSTMITEGQAAANNQKLVAYNDFLRQLAVQRHLPLADLNADMQAELAKRKAADPKSGGNLLTVDGVHMNGYGNEMMATGILKTFGLTDDQIAAAKAKWDDLPGAMIVDVKVPLSLNDYLKLQSATAGENKPVDQVIAADVVKDAQDRIKGSAAPVPPIK
ncbi:MAG TPA: SGNH/GDSL hydrolase family protein [Candidatus Methylacidiphilales bacterium]|jgi:lysophospholipase L1-like esterase|nr:SGNH/GDSL hydrolase family protein [Candidatus Methylacidiphilales bacterium]